MNHGFAAHTFGSHGLGGHGFAGRALAGHGFGSYGLASHGFASHTALVATPMAGGSVQVMAWRAGSLPTTNSAQPAD